MKLLLEQIAADYHSSDCRIFKLRRQADTTDWHVRQFSREVGLTPWHLVRQCRMETSSVYLRDTPWKVAEIAGPLPMGRLSSW